MTQNGQITVASPFGTPATTSEGNRLQTAVSSAREAMEVKFWHHNYRHDPYTGAPAWVWYIDNSGREVKRPYEE